MTTLSRTYCTHVSNTHVGKTLSLCGWIDTVRDHGHVLFIHLRDTSGLIQIVFDRTQTPELYAKAETLRHEFVVRITGLVRQRSEDTVNPNLSTGQLEVVVQDLEILNTSDTPPFEIAEKLDSDGETHFGVDEDLRLKYRYIDLRRAPMQQALKTRYKILKTIRDYLDEHHFTEVETPTLTKSTPEGARDYLVPSRVHPEHFYALPQSPQLFKQLLMISGLDRYFQVAKCFRDEDLRPNRQPEFTQIDLEASFIDETFIFPLVEGMLKAAFKHGNITLPDTFEHITYQDAMEHYGTDRPDLRFDLKLVNVTHLVQNTSYKIFKTILENGGTVKGLNIKGKSKELSKNVLQEDLAKSVIQKLGGKGLTWMRVENGQLESNIVQFFSPEELKAMADALGGEDGDVLVFVADSNPRTVNEVLGRFRSYIAHRLNMIPDTFAACWVVDFPLFELHEGRLTAVHHPFTQAQTPLREGMSQDELLALKARAYDVVVNGEELGGGSIRIHDATTQNILFKLLKLSPSEIEEKFGFFVKALRYGAPPHGGLALGVDRLVSMVLGTESIREVIAFPKNRVAFCPLTQAPDKVTAKQLKDIHLQVAVDLS
ncbi:MAG: aspartate--tRNA ligase [Candidatus Margulisiibacteriota bacterium]